MRIGRGFFSRPWLRWRAARHEADGYVAAMVAIGLASGLFMAAAAVAIDTSRWYVEMERVQKAADAAATGGVPYLPYDFEQASVVAKQIAAVNGFPEKDGTEVTVSHGNLDSQLKVVISARVANSFGASFGAASTRVKRTATADYKAAAPMGSPCNTFGNEPDSGGTASAVKPTLSAIHGEFKLPTDPKTGVVLDPGGVGCSSRPQMWGAIQGPSTNKGSGDRFMNKTCLSTQATYECDSTKKLNNEYDPAGYFWMISVGARAVGQPISVQVYDPGYVYTGMTCEAAPTVSSNTPNDYTADGVKRFAKNNTTLGVNQSPYCSGDYIPGSITTGPTPVVSYLVRQATESLDPLQGEPINGCNMQVKPWPETVTKTAPVVGNFTKGNSNYNDQLAQTFHQWYPVCTFIPATAGDYYLQVRTNVKFGGTPVPNAKGTSIISRNNQAVTLPDGNDTASWGINSFSIRAVIQPNAQSEQISSLQQYVSVSAYERMPMFASSVSATTSTFHLIRVLPGSAGQKIQFEFFDVSDGGTNTAGTITVLAPKDATGSIKTTPFPGGCTSNGGSYAKETVLSGCAASVSALKNDAQLGTTLIPIPPDYDCDYSRATGCWYKVAVSLNNQVNDITTWKATVIGDPVRLIQ